MAIKSYKIIVVIFAFIFFLVASGVVHANSTGFDYPVGAPNGEGYYDAQGFGEWNSRFAGYHLGEDWNRKCGGDCDLGDPISNVSEGRVIFKKSLDVWGNVVIVRHRINESIEVDSMYAHMKNVYVSEGDSVNRSTKVGTIGKGAGDGFPAHLHFEIRDNLTVGASVGYGALKPKGWLAPTVFIAANRPVASQNITGVVDKNQSSLSWDKNTSTNFDHYEIYRSNVSGGTENPATRTTVATINDQNVTNFSDQNLPAGNYYYKIVTFYKNGMMAYSNEFSLEIKREITKITMTNADQRQPFIYEGKIYWQDTPNGGTNSTGGLYSYDMKSGKVEVKNISNCGVKFPYSPTGNDGKIVFYGNTGNTYGTEVCYYNLTTNTFLPISLSPLPKEQWYPTITDSGLIIWEDNRPGNFDLYFLDPAKSNGPEVFVSAFGQQINPRTWGNKVIWKDNRSNGNYDIFMKDLSGGSETKVAENAGDDFADIWDKYIVWDFRGKLYLKNYETGETKTLHETGVGYNPRVRDGKVAYTLVEGNTSYIHIYDIATGKDLKIDFPLNFQSNLFVSQAYLAFDSANKATPWDFDIYLTQL